MKFYEKYPELRGLDYAYVLPHGDYKNKKLKGIEVDEEKFAKIRRDIHPSLRLEFIDLADSGTTNFQLPTDEEELVWANIY